MDELESLVCRFCCAQNQISTAYEEFSRQNGCTSTCMQIMYLIYNHPGCTQKMLNESSLYPKQTINAVITQLYKDNVVELRENPDDRRSKAIHYSEEGKRRADEFFLKAQRIAYDAMQELTENERNELVEITEKFARLMMNNVNR